MDTRHISAADVIASVNCRDYVRSVWGKPTHQGGKYDQYVSQWRDEKNPSFAVYADGFKDFGGAGESGSVIDFAMRQHGLTFQEALHTLAGSNILTPDFHRQPTAQKPKETPHEPPPMEWQHDVSTTLNSLTSAWDTPQGMQARAYLNQRGISDDLIDRFNIRFNPDWLNTGYLQDDKPVSIAPGIVIPNWIDGVLWGVKIRRFEGKHKYTHVKGSKPSAPFNADSLTPESPVLICEGEFDAILAQAELGDGWAVITLGGASQRLANRWHDLLKTAPSVYACFDNDSAGREAFANLPADIQAKPVILPTGIKDITDYILSGGALIDVVGQLEPLAVFSDGLPDGWRHALLNYAGSAALPLWERLNVAFIAGELDTAAFTTQEVIDLNELQGWGLADKAIRHGLNSLDGIVISHFLGYKECINTIPKSGKKPPGRPTLIYQLNDLETAKNALLALAYPEIVMQHCPTDSAALPEPDVDMLETVGLDTETAWNVTGAMFAIYDDLEADTDTPDPQARMSKRARRFINRDVRRLQCWIDAMQSTPLEITPCNDSQYRAVFLRALSRPDERTGQPVQRSYSEISALTGLDTKSIPNLLKRAGIQNEKQYSEPIPVTSYQNMACTIRQHAVRVKGKAEALLISSPVHNDEIRILKKTPAEIEELVEKALKAGYAVELVYRIASKQHVERDTPLPVDEPAAVASDDLENEPKADPPESQPTSSETESSPETPRRERGAGYTRVWVLGTLRKYCQRAGHEPPPDAGRDELIALLGVKPDDLIAFAVNELGGVVVSEVSA